MVIQWKFEKFKDLHLVVPILKKKTLRNPNRFNILKVLPYQINGFYNYQTKLQTAGFSVAAPSCTLPRARLKARAGRAKRFCSRFQLGFAGINIIIFQFGIDV